MHLATLFKWEILSSTGDGMNTNQNLKKELFDRWIGYNNPQETRYPKSIGRGNLLFSNKAVGEVSVRLDDHSIKRLCHIVNNRTNQ